MNHAQIEKLAAMAFGYGLPLVHAASGAVTFIVPAESNGLYDPATAAMPAQSATEYAVPGFVTNQKFEEHNQGTAVIVLGMKFTALFADLPAVLQSSFSTIAGIDLMTQGGSNYQARIENGRVMKVRKVLINRPVVVVEMG